MRMFQLCVCGEPLKASEQPTPKPTGSEVLLKVLAAGVCHSDLHLADGWFDLGGGKTAMDTCNWLLDQGAGNAGTSASGGRCA